MGRAGRVLVADAAGAVVDLARPAIARADVPAVMPEVGSDLLGSQSYARVSPGAKLRLHIVSHDGGTLCEVGAGD